MYARLLFIVLAFMLSSVAHGQITYSYTDPCTGIIKSISVPSNCITVTYYGQINTFQATDFYNGAFESWAQTVFGSFGGNNPCASVVGLPTGINIAQGTTLNFINIVNSLDALQSLSAMGGGTNILSGAQNAAKVDKKDGNKNGNTSTNPSSSGNASNGNNSTSSQQTNSSSQGSQNSQNTQGGSGNQGGSSSESQNNQGSNSNGQNSGGSTGEGGQGNETTEEGGKTNLVGSSVSSTQNSTGSSASNKNGNRPSIIASSDFVGFNFKNSDVSYGGKVTGGYTALRWDGKRSYGVLADYTTALRGPNISGFYAFMKPKRIDLISTSVTIGFDTKPTVYGTLALGQMWSFGKLKKAKALYMLTASSGQVYGEPFLGTAGITGVMYDMKIGKRFDIKLMGLYVYAPYVSYYNDILLKSPHVILPIIGTNIGITKKFKININGGGAWALRENALNYTIMMGTRFLL